MYVPYYTKKGKSSASTELFTMIVCIDDVNIVNTELINKVLSNQLMLN